MSHPTHTHTTVFPMSHSILYIPNISELSVFDQQVVHKIHIKNQAQASLIFILVAARTLMTISYIPNGSHFTANPLFSKSFIAVSTNSAFEKTADLLFFNNIWGGGVGGKEYLVSYTRSL